MSVIHISVLLFFLKFVFAHDQEYKLSLVLQFNSVQFSSVQFSSVPVIERGRRTMLLKVKPGAGPFKCVC